MFEALLMSPDPPSPATPDSLPVPRWLPEPKRVEPSGRPPSLLRIFSLVLRETLGGLYPVRPRFTIVETVQREGWKATS